jgi:hypothetical protein
MVMQALFRLGVHGVDDNGAALALPQLPVNAASGFGIAFRIRAEVQPDFILRIGILLVGGRGLGVLLVLVMGAGIVRILAARGYVDMRAVHHVRLQSLDGQRHGSAAFGFLQIDLRRGAFGHPGRVIGHRDRTFGVLGKRSRAKLTGRLRRRAPGSFRRKGIGRRPDARTFSCSLRSAARAQTEGHGSKADGQKVGCRFHDASLRS